MFAFAVLSVSLGLSHVMKMNASPKPNVIYVCMWSTFGTLTIDCGALGETEHLEISAEIL
jgi:hypothetical protein